MKKLGFIFFFNLLLIFGSSCEKENTEFETDPKKAILGKWEITEMGNWPDLMPVKNPISYTEYLPDSVMRVYVYETGEYFYYKYSIDSLLYEYATREDGHHFVISRYKYDFFEKNKMRLDYHNFAAIFNTFIYKKLK